MGSHVAFDITNCIPTMMMIPPSFIMGIIIVITIISIHACCLSNRTKQAGQTVKHAFSQTVNHAFPSLSKQTTKQARQTATSIAQYVLKQAEPAIPTALSDDCSSSPSMLTKSECSNYPFRSQIKLFKFESLVPSVDDCSISPSTIAKQTIRTTTNYPFEPKSLIIPFGDCPLSPSIISQFQTEASVDLPLHSAATTTEATTNDPTSPSSPTASVAGPPRRPTSDLPLRSTDTATAGATDDPTSPSLPTVTVSGPPRRPTLAYTASVDLPLRSTASSPTTVAGPPR
jgi:hypothetical protein